MDTIDIIDTMTEFLENQEAIELSQPIITSKDAVVL